MLAHAGASLAQTVWTKHSGNPVLKAGEAGQWDIKYVEPGAVLFRDSTYHLWYNGFDGSYWKIGYATSPVDTQ